MNMKQAEMLSGISRRNIRFYEDKGLLHPQRNEGNDYREYTQADIDVLKLIRMLRMLDVPLEQIKDVLDGRMTVQEAAETQAMTLRENMSRIKAAIDDCEMLGRMNSVGTEEVENMLRHMDGQEDSLFAAWKKDYKQMADAEGKKMFTIVPDGAVTTPEEFAQELRSYAAENHLDLTLTKGGMYPEFTLSGIAYTAERIYTRIGPVPAAVIRCSAKNPETLDRPGRKQKVMKAIHHSWIYLLYLPFVIVLFRMCGGINMLSDWKNLVLFLSIVIVMGMMVFRYKYFHENEKH